MPLALQIGLLEGVNTYLQDLAWRRSVCCVCWTSHAHGDLQAAIYEPSHGCLCLSRRPAALAKGIHKFNNSRLWMAGNFSCTEAPVARVVLQAHEHAADLQRQAGQFPPAQWLQAAAGSAQRHNNRKFAFQEHQSVHTAICIVCSHGDVPPDCLSDQKTDADATWRLRGPCYRLTLASSSGWSVV